MSDYFRQRNKDINPRIAASLCTPSHLTKKRRNCESSFLVPDTPCIWCANRWKCSLFEHRKCIWCLLYFYTERNGILCMTIMHAINNIKPLQDRKTRQRPPLLKERMSIWLQWSNKCDLCFHVFMRRLIFIDSHQSNARRINGNAQSADYLPLTKSGVYTIWHEETECSGMTSLPR
ncbi:hypothetical protein T07_3619 [Trichinella nelsoni]|uniref:Uncharacterized protein n=1 Tax=Trichinella nelsoni TaxID=6336 RepID=A0A0V0SAK9_9BILA|nr:hypothetical protein T07_3619 [Trichinella nelsoni]